MTIKIAHRAAAKARKFMHRMVWVIRDTLGKLHFRLSAGGIRGKLLMRCGAYEDRLVIIRY